MRVHQPDRPKNIRSLGDPNKMLKSFRSIIQTRRCRDCGDIRQRKSTDCNACGGFMQIYDPDRARNIRSLGDPNKGSTAFERAWELVKARTPEEIRMYEAGICPNCRGTGETTTTLPAHFDDPPPEDETDEEVKAKIEAWAKALGDPIGEDEEPDWEHKELSPPLQRKRDEEGHVIRLQSPCHSCRGTGKPNEEHWAIDGIHELNEEWAGLPKWGGEE